MKLTYVLPFIQRWTKVILCNKSTVEPHIMTTLFRRTAHYGVFFLPKTSQVCIQYRM